MALRTEPGEPIYPPLDLAALTRLDQQIDETVIGRAVHSTNRLAELTGWDMDDLEDLILWAGMPKAAPDEPAHTMLDSASLIQLRKAVDREALTKEEVGTVIRSISYAMERLATSEIESLVHRLTRRGLSDTAARLKAAEYAPKVADPSIRLIEVLWRRHLAAAIRRLTTGTILLRGVSDDGGQFPLVGAIGFARIVDFPIVSADFGVADYVEFVQDFNNRVSDIINSAGARVIKLMGDTVAWAAPTAEIGAEIALNLTAMASRGFPAQVRAGVTWCRFVVVEGDVFGPGVTLAAALSETPPPGQVYLDAAAANQLKNLRKYTLTAAPPLNVPGVSTDAPYLLERTPMMLPD